MRCGGVPHCRAGTQVQCLVTLVGVSLVVARAILLNWLEFYFACCCGLLFVHLCFEEKALGWVV